MILGELKITLLEGELTHDTEMFGHMDPYVVFKLNSVALKSSVCDDQGLIPKWTKSDVFKFKISEQDTEIIFDVFDKDFMKDDLVGSGVI